MGMATIGGRAERPTPQVELDVVGVAAVIGEVAMQRNLVRRGIPEDPARLAVGGRERPQRLGSMAARRRVEMRGGGERRSMLVGFVAGLGP